MRKRLTKREGEPPSRKKTISSKIQDKISKTLVSYLVKTPVTPNQITIFRLTILIPLSAYFLVQGMYGFEIVGILLYIFNNILDYVDGDLARAKKVSSSTGDLIEHTADILGENILVFGVALGSYRILNDVMIFVMAILSIIAINTTKFFSINLDLDRQEKQIPLKILDGSFKFDKLILSIVTPENQVLKILLFPSFLIVITTFLNLMFVSLYLIPILCSIRAIAMFYTLYRESKMADLRLKTFV